MHAHISRKGAVLPRKAKRRAIGNLIFFAIYCRMKEITRIGGG
jgi:hypothetical protein